MLDDLSDICVPRLETIDENIKEIHNSILMTSNYIYDLIDIYMEEKYNISDKQVLDSTKSILKQIVKDNESTKQFEYANTDWEILRLSFDNMYGYGPGNVLDFTKFSVSDVIGIFADNGMGKSSIIDILCFMLFSRSARDKTAVLPKDIINVNATKSHGELIIKSLGSLYIINRECYRHNERKNKSITKSFTNSLELNELIPYDEKNDHNIKANKIYLLNGKKYVKTTRTEEQRKNTDDIIKKIVGSYENFIITTLLLQNSTKTFRDLPNKEKKIFLYEILKIDYFNNAFGEIDSKYKELKKSQKVKELECANIVSTNKLLLERNDDIQSNIIPSIKSNLRKQDEEKNNLNMSIEQLIGEQIHIPLNIDIQNDFDSENIKKKLISIKSNIDNKSLCINQLKEKISGFEKSLQELNLIKQGTKITKQYNDHLQNVKVKQNKLLDQINSLNELKQTYKLIKTSTSDINSLLEQIKEKEYDLDLNVQNKTITDKRLEDINNIKSKLNLINRKDQIINSNIEYKNSLNADLKQLFVEKESLNIKKQKLLNEINELEDDINNDTIDLLIAETNKQIKSIKSFLLNINTRNKVVKREEIYTAYNELINSSEETIYEKLNELKTKKFVRLEFNKDVDQIIGSLNILLKKELNDCSIVIEYNDYILFEENIKLREAELNTLNQKLDEYNELLKQNRANKILLKKINEIDDQLNIISDKITKISSIMTNNPETEEYVKLNEEIQILSVVEKQLSDIKLENIEYEQTDQILSDQIIFIKNEIRYIEQNIETLKQIEKIDMQIMDIRNDMKSLDTNETAIDIVTLYNKLQTEIDQKNKYSEQIITYKNNSFTEKQLIVKLQTELTTIQRNIEMYESNKLNIQHNQKINNQIDELRNNMQIIDNEIKQLNDHLIQQTIIYEKNSLLIDHNNSLLTELNDLKFTTQTYKCLSDITGVNGIPIYLLEKRLSDFTNKINCILKPFINKSIELEITDDGGVDIILKTEDDKVIYTLGGMESMMLDLTFKIIMSQMSIMPKCNLIFIDESISVMDKNRINNIDELFSFLRQYYSNIFLITHIEEIKYKVDKHLYIVKLNNRSLLRNIDGLTYIDISNDRFEDKSNNDLVSNVIPDVIKLNKTEINNEFSDTYNLIKNKKSNSKQKLIEVTIESKIKEISKLSPQLVETKVIKKNIKKKTNSDTLDV